MKMVIFHSFLYVYQRVVIPPIPGVTDPTQYIQAFQPPKGDQNINPSGRKIGNLDESFTFYSSQLSPPTKKSF